MSDENDFYQDIILDHAATMAAIDAANEASKAGMEDQEQLVMAIKAYVAHVENSK